MQSDTSRRRTSGAAGSTGASGQAARSRRRLAPPVQAHRPSGFAAPDAKARPAPAAKPSSNRKPAPERNSAPKREEKQIQNKRRRGERSGGWRIALLAVGAAVAVAFLVALIVASTRGTYHQLPKITRIEEEEPGQSASPEDGAPEGLAIPAGNAATGGSGA